MDIDASRFRKIARAVFAQFEPGYRDNDPPLSATDAVAIIGLARLAVDADDREDEDEIAVLDSLVGHVCELAGITPPPEGALPRDNIERSARLRALAAPLQGKPSGALGFVVAYLLTISDMDIAPVESDFVNELRDAVGLGDNDAKDLASTVSEIVTPEE